MAQLIDKANVVAEIERLIKSPILYKSENVETRINVLEYLLSFLDTLEVKEVDLDEEIKSYFKGFGKFPSVGIDDCIDIAKHFFELGLNAQQK